MKYFYIFNSHIQIKSTMSEFTESQLIIGEIISQIESKIDSEVETKFASEVEKIMTMKLIETSIEQLCSKQDIVAAFSIDEEDDNEAMDVILAMDGHGHNVAVDVLKNIQDLPEHFRKADPAESLQQVIDVEVEKKKAESDALKYVSGTSYRDYMKSKIADKDIRSSGATLSFAKIKRNVLTKHVKILLEWLGDSPIIVFINGELVFESEIHHTSNQSEIKRLQDKGVLKCVEKGGGGFTLLNENTIVSTPGEYVVFNNNTQLAVTRSIGHERITGIETQKHTIECSTEDDVKILIYSDGVGDMLYMDTDLEKLQHYSASELVDLAKTRWQQVWNYGSKTTKFSSNGYDDCCCAMWWQKKI